MEVTMISHYKIIKELDFERLAGTEGEKKAIEVLGKYLKELGYEPQLHAFEINTFETGTAVVSVDGKEFMGRPYGMNDAVDFEAELSFVDHADIVGLNQGAYKGKIVMSYGFSRKLGNDLLKGGAAGYIGIGAPFKGINSSSHRQKSYEEGYVNSMNIAHDDAIKLSRYSGKMVNFKIEQTVSKRNAHNIIVDIPGKGVDETLTIACGHYDTVASTMGSSDNAGGTVTLVKLAEFFKKNPPKRDLRLIFFSGEELGLLGSQAYVKDHLEEIEKRVKLVMNIDVSGDPIGKDMLTVIGTNKLLGYADGLIKEEGMVFNNNLDIYSSDNMPFTPYEIPSINLMRFGGKATANIHTSGDNFKNTSARGYENTIKAATTILNRILNAGVFPVTKEIDNTLRERIEKYLYNLNFEKPELKWTPKYKK